LFVTGTVQLSMDCTDGERRRTPIKVELEEDVGDLTERLSRIPGPEYIASRPGAKGKRFYYLSGEKSTCLANEIFGTTGWSSSVKSVSTDELEVTPSVIKVLVTAVVRVTCLYPNKYGHCAFHEDVGTGFAQVGVKSQVDVAKQKADAVDHAKKTAITDGRKRALRQFGNAVGLFLTDEDAVKVALRQQSEVPSYSVHRKSLSVSRMNTPVSSVFGSVNESVGGLSPVKRRATEMNMDHVRSEDGVRLAQALESADWDSFEVDL
jgi:DNA repair and recombination protein RAD52